MFQLNVSVTSREMIVGTGFPILKKIRVIKLNVFLECNGEDEASELH